MINMKMRKFWKKFLRVRTLLIIVLIVLVGIFAFAYLNKPLAENKITVDNMEFTTDGFVDYSKVAEKDLKTNKVVAENKKYKMFLDETTTIMTTVVKSSLKSGGDANNPEDYAVKYTTAETDGLPATKANFALKYSSTDIAKSENKEFNAYNQSVSYINSLTNEKERHYQIKYLEDQNAVQIYYTIGNFGTINAYFPQQMYATVYEPAKALYYEVESVDSSEKIDYTNYEEEELVFNEAAYNEAMEKYTSYLETVGNLSNTFEERFRGNVQSFLVTKNYESGKEVYYKDEIIVHSIEARDYLIDTVFPEMAAEGFEVPELDKAELDKEARQSAYLAKTKEKVSFKISGIPSELVDYRTDYYKKYFNNEDSPLTNNPFLTAPLYNTLQTTYFKENAADGISIELSYYKLTVSPGPSASGCYDLLYTDKQTFQGGAGYVIYDSELDEYVPFASTGFPARDDEGNFLYEEDGTIKKQLYTLEQVSKDNSFFALETEGLPIFKIALEFKLTDKGIVISLPQKSLIDSTNVTEDDPMYKDINGVYQISEISLCPYMTREDGSQSGYIIIPDGSGAVINFNNGKTSTVSASYYGKDLAYVDDVKVEDTAKLLLGMYAFVNTTEANPGGLIAVIEKGGGQISVTAGVDDSNKQNYAYYSAVLRSRESVKTGTVADNTPFDKYDKVLCPSDIVLNYLILDENETDYSSVAKKYRDYLIERDGLTYNDNTNTSLNELTFLGAFDKYALLLGIKYMTSDSLTTFDQAQEILDELINNNVNNFTVSYKGWTKENLEYQLGGSLKVSNVLGKAASMSKFYQYCVGKGITFYPELNVTTTKGYDYSFGSTKFTTRSVSNEESIHYPFDLATGRPDKKLQETHILSPLYYKSISEKLIADFNKLNMWNSEENGGFYLTDLGNKWSGNYKVNKQVYGGDAILYQQQALEILTQGNKIKIEAPCDYAFKYVDIAVGVPVTSNMYTIYDETIPFYQLVVNGLFDYTTENVNGLSNRSSAWYFAKALESGSNFSYLISAEDPAILLDTDYTQYYQAYYANWKETIINFTKEIDKLGIHNCYLTDYQIINGVSKVTYTNKTNNNETMVLVVNSTNVDKQYNGITIPAYGYIKEK